MCTEQQWPIHTLVFHILVCKSCVLPWPSLWLDRCTQQSLNELQGCTALMVSASLGHPNTCALMSNSVSSCRPFSLPQGSCCSLPCSRDRLLKPHPCLSIQLVTAFVRPGSWRRLTVNELVAAVAAFSKSLQTKLQCVRRSLTLRCFNISFQSSMGSTCIATALMTNGGAQQLCQTSSSREDCLSKENNRRDKVLLQQTTGRDGMKPAQRCCWPTANSRVQVLVTSCCNACCNKAIQRLQLAPLHDLGPAGHLCKMLST